MKPLFQELPFPIDSHIHFYVEDLPHFIVPWHYHPAIEIMYITSGTGTRFVGDHVEGYFEGDVCMIGPQLPHEWRNDPVYFDKSSGLRATIIRKTKCFDFWERNVLFPKTKRSFFRTPKHPLPCPFPLNFSLLIITKKFGNLAKNRYICIV